MKAVKRCLSKLCKQVTGNAVPSYIARPSNAIFKITKLKATETASGVRRQVLRAKDIWVFTCFLINPLLDLLLTQG